MGTDRTLDRKTPYQTVYENHPEAAIKNMIRAR
jgi:hypothetical protein